MDQLKQARYGIDSYLDWVEKEGLLVHKGLAIDCFKVETREWARTGVPSAVLHLDGRGDYCNAFVFNIPAGGSTVPQRHLYEEIVYVLEGHGSTQIELPNGETRSFEWGPTALFAIPLNATYRHFNGSGLKRALITTTTNAPMMLNLFHNERFVFDNPFFFDERVGKKEYFAGEGVLNMVRQGNNTWETNFIANLSTIDLPDFSDRGAGGGNLIFLLADSSMHAHVSEMPAGTYKKAHRHVAGYNVMCVAGSGFSLMWFEPENEYVRIDWHHGVLFPPAHHQFHQHFTTSKVAARYLAMGFGSLRYPFTQERRDEILGADVKFSTSIKKGGDQVEYEDQDPRIHPIWLAEMKKNGLTPMMDKFFPAERATQTV
jgi:mannose-6-phosphate isomerase-like protein (cupin superfamily)